MTTVTITLRDEDRAFLQHSLESGRYATESETVADALAELRAREKLHLARMAELKEKIEVGIGQLDRGEGVLWNADEIRAKGQSLRNSRQSAA